MKNKSIKSIIIKNEYILSSLDKRINKQKEYFITFDSLSTFYKCN